MNYIDEFRQKETAQGILKKIHEISRRNVNIMEICGTHTHTISKYGIRNSLPSTIRLISGPGCPVCVTSAADIDTIIEFSKNEKDVIIATFGDMMRVPGTALSLQELKSMGRDIRVVYSPLGSIDIAKANPGREVLLYAVGFETTAPTVAATVLTAKEEQLKNLSVLAVHKLTPPAMNALLGSGELRLHGFICPGHVTAIIGAKAYKFISDDYHAPCVVAGFEPLDTIHGLYMLINQLENGRTDIEIQYKRVVTWEGNTKAQKIIDQVFEICDSDWRGIGRIPMSGLSLRKEYAEYDAKKRFCITNISETLNSKLKTQNSKLNLGCSCGEVLKGLITPDQCPLFGKLCTPETPI
ncbi:MAG: hydrogenase formation protein HypD [Candidatus Brocadiaceae bacterium]